MAIEWDVVERVPLFQNLEPENLVVLQDLLTLQTSQAKVTLLDFNRPNRSVYFLDRGTITVYLQRGDGPKVVLGILGAGELLGEMSAHDCLPTSASVQTLEPCRLLHMDAGPFARCLNEMPLLAHNLRRFQHHRNRRLTERIEALITLDVAGRVALQLLALAEDYGKSPNGCKGLEHEKNRPCFQALDNAEAPTADATTADASSAIRTPTKERHSKSQPPCEADFVFLPLRLKQADLAGLVGASREEVNRVLSSFQNHGLISYSSGYQIRVQDLNGLRRKIDYTKRGRERKHADNSS